MRLAESAAKSNSVWWNLGPRKTRAESRMTLRSGQKLATVTRWPNAVCVSPSARSVRAAARYVEYQRPHAGVPLRGMSAESAKARAECGSPSSSRARARKVKPNVLLRSQIDHQLPNIVDMGNLPAGRTQDVRCASRHVPSAPKPTDRVVA